MVENVAEFFVGVASFCHVFILSTFPFGSQFINQFRACLMERLPPVQHEFDIQPKSKHIKSTYLFDDQPKPIHIKSVYRLVTFVCLCKTDLRTRRASLANVEAYGTWGNSYETSTHPGIGLEKATEKQ